MRFFVKFISFYWMWIIILGIGPAFCKTYKLEVLPRYFPIELFQRFQPLVEYLSKETGIRLKLVVPDNFDDHMEKFTSKMVDFSYSNPIIYLKIANYATPLAVANKGKDGVRFRGIIITSSGSKLRNISQLPGKKVAIVAYTSAGGYISQVLMLRKKKVDISTINFYEAKDNKQENVILDVNKGIASAGFIRESAFTRMDKDIGKGQLRIIGYGEWLPNWIFAARKGIDEKVKEKIRKALLKLKEGDNVLKRAHLNKFEEVNISELQRLKREAKEFCSCNNN